MTLKIPEFALIALIGISGSGKSSFAHKHFIDTEIVADLKREGFEQVIHLRSVEEIDSAGIDRVPLDNE